MKKKPSENDRMTGYVAFLRGINVGGNNLIKMEDLKKVFETMGFRNVKTLLASGNVIFDTVKEKTLILGRIIGEKLETTFGYNNGVIVRSIKEIQNLADIGPFKNITVTPETRLYITFLPEKPKSNLKIPYESPEKDFKILQVTDTEVCSVITLSHNRNTLDAMNILEKEFGKKITTRNWNTIERILKNSRQ
jgi:uncharacterized protein (DUF1697 family)